MKIFPVVHMNSSDKNAASIASEESLRAFELGADGVYLIDNYRMDEDTRPLFEAFNDILAKQPNRYVGLNILGLTPANAVRALAKSLGKESGLIVPPLALWIDDMSSEKANFEAIEMKRADKRLKLVRIIGGIAFKDTDSYTDDSEMARQEALSLYDSIDGAVTSGDFTGEAPSIEKCVAIKGVIGKKPLAVEGEISIDRIADYNGVVNEWMFTSSAETKPISGRFDLAELEALIKAAHKLAK